MQKNYSYPLDLSWSTEELASVLSFFNKVEEAYEMGADIVIASDIGAPVVEKDDYNILSVMSQANTRIN